MGEGCWSCPLGAPWGRPSLERVQQHPTESRGRGDPAPETGKQSRVGLCSLGLALIQEKENPFSLFPERAEGFICIPAIPHSPWGPGAIPNHSRAGWLCLLHVQGGAFPKHNQRCGLLLGSALAPGSLPEAESGFCGRDVGSEGGGAEGVQTQRDQVGGAALGNIPFAFYLHLSEV